MSNLTKNTNDLKDVLEILANKVDSSTLQPKHDEALNTESKEIVGAINELHNGIYCYSKGLSYTSISSEDGTCYFVTGIGTCKDSDIIIPSNYNGLPVRGIATSAFQDNTSIKKVVMPDTVLEIYGLAFKGCTALEEVMLSNSVTNLGLDEIFSGCTSLKKINLPSGLTTIGLQCFYNCKTLERVVIPKNVTYIGSTAFANCNSLTSIVIPDSVTTISVDAFAACSLLTIYCEADSKPSGWHGGWNSTNCPVVWGFANDFVAVNDKLGDISTVLTALITKSQDILEGGTE